MSKNIFYFLIAVGLILLSGFYFFGKTNSTNTIKTVAFVSISEVDNNTFEGFKNKMATLGWIENKNIRYFIQHPAKNVPNLAPIIENAIKYNPDMILSASTPATQEVKKQLKGKNIPVVFCPVNDPVSANIVANPNAPEGTITGIRLPFGDTKRFEWLYVIAPNVKNILIPYTKDDGGSIVSRADIYKSAEFLGANLIEIAIDENIPALDFIQSVKKPFDAIFIPRDSRVEVKIEDFARYAIEHKIPLSAPSYQQVEKGALFTYGFIHSKLGEDAAVMSDRILKGVKPTDIPVKFGDAYLVINQTTATKIGITLPENAIRNANQILK